MCRFQFEEHAIDCLGRRYSFIDYFNTVAFAKFGALLDARTITLINVPLTWLITPLFAIMAHGKGRFDAVPIYLMWSARALAHLKECVHVSVNRLGYVSCGSAGGWPSSTRPSSTSCRPC